MQKQYSLQEHIQIAKASGLPLCVLDGSLKCVYGGGVINKGDRLPDMLHRRIELPVKSCVDGCATVKDRFYCVRVFPIYEAISPEYYLCEVLDSSAVTALADNTDISMRTISSLSAMKYRIREAEELCDILSGNPSFDVQSIAADLSAKLNRLGIMIDRHSAYNEMLHACGRRVLFDAGKLCERLCERCNNALSERGKAISMPLYNEPHYICADGRYSVIAFLNMIYEALLFSESDSPPQPVIYRDDRTGCTVIKLLNVPSAVFAASEEARLRFELVKRYAKLSGGSVESVDNMMALSVPSATAEELSSCTLQEDIDALYDTEIERCLLALAAECEMTANVQ